MGLKLLKPEEEEDIDTLGGLVFALVGRVPARGELIRHPAGLEFEVLDADPRRVKKVRIYNVNARRLERNRRESKRRDNPPSMTNAQAPSDRPTPQDRGIAPKKGAHGP
jgi:hypothetical protein